MTSTMLGVKVDRAEPVIMRIGIADEIRRQRIEQRAGRLNMLVHDTLDAVRVAFGGGLSPQAGGIGKPAGS